MLLKFLFSVLYVSLVNGEPAPAPAPAPASSHSNSESYKDQYCTDPRTMRKHAAYTEWADAYSCSRHRCQPGGRNLAIYTVGCKRVEAPESAIECEEVVEDTNMQFPYCCTRLRCLVVVRGEVWTRVLGQPWETLPAAPWSHMYKMKKPPPGDTTFLPKGPEQGPVYELAEPEGAAREKVLRASTTGNTDCSDIVPRSAPAPAPAPSLSSGPDIVIALSTNAEQKEEATERKHNKRKKMASSFPFYEEEKERDVEVLELEDIPVSSDKPIEQTSEEKMFINSLATQKSNNKPNKLPIEVIWKGTEVCNRKLKNSHHQSWTEIPPSQWDSESEDTIKGREEPIYNQADFPEERAEKKEEKPSNLQALVDAIGTRMRDIENVVQRMSEKVQQAKPEDEFSMEKRPDAQKKHHKTDSKEHNKTKKKDPDGDEYKRFSRHNRGSKYLRTGEFTTDRPLFVEDSHLNGYYSDASNTLARRANAPKEPIPTYMAPVETRRKTVRTSETSDDTDKKRKKHHKRKNRKHSHKKHHAKEDKKKRFNKLTSTEAETKNAISLEDSGSVH